MDEDGVIRLRRVISWLARQLNASSTGAGLTPSQASVLSVIVRRGPLSLAELTNVEALNPTMLSRVVSKLQSMELIDRTPDPDDGRSAWVAATDRGSAIDAQIKEQRATVVSQCLAQLSAEDESALSAAIPGLENLARATRAADTRAASFRAASSWRPGSRGRPRAGARACPWSSRCPPRAATPCAAWPRTCSSCRPRWPAAPRPPG
jgi:DNA-binding MarR family transcriptional regulator